MNILITGIYGFLGYNLANELVKEHNVVGVYNKNKNNSLNKNIITCNSLDSLHVEPDVVIMCHAAVASGEHLISEFELKKSNVYFTKQIIEKFSTTPCVYISSVSVYRTNGTQISERSEEKPLSDYAKSKLLAENIVRSNPKNKIIRVSSLYGIGMKENTLIPNYCKQALQFKKIEVWGNGSRFQNYIHVLDLVELIKDVINTNQEINFPILAVDAKEYSNLEVAKIISDFTLSEIEFVKEDFSTSVHYNNELTRKALHWRPRVSLELGIKKYLEWRRKQF